MPSATDGRIEAGSSRLGRHQQPILPAVLLPRSTRMPGKPFRTCRRDGRDTKQHHEDLRDLLSTRLATAHPQRGRSTTRGHVIDPGRRIVHRSAHCEGAGAHEIRGDIAVDCRICGYDASVDAPCSRSRQFATRLMALTTRRCRLVRPVIGTMPTRPKDRHTSRIRRSPRSLLRLPTHRARSGGRAREARAVPTRREIPGRSAATTHS